MSPQETPDPILDLAHEGPMEATEAGRISLRLIGWTAVISLGAIHAWYWRDTIDEDGMSYLDVADAYFRGDFRQAINAYWSPLYSWVVGLALHVVRPERFQELAVVHIVNFLIFLVAFLAFEYLLSQLLELRRASMEKAGQSDLVALPDSYVVLISYALFIVFSLRWIGIRAVQPDMALSAFLYLAMGLVVRVRVQEAKLRHLILLGAVHGGAGSVCLRVYVAEIKNVDKILSENGSVKAQIVSLLRNTGAKAVIAYNLPENKPKANRISLTDTGVRAYAFPLGQ